MGAKVSTVREINVENTKSEAKLPPHNYTSILNGDTKPAIDTSSNSFNDNICQQLRSGVFLKGKEIHKDKLVMKYWIDKNNNNCFMVFARSLSITWGDDIRYWRWLSLKESQGSDEYNIDAAELLNVCWLEVSGGIDTAWLSPGVEYEVAFVVMLKDPASGWEFPVTLGFNLPTEPKKEQKLSLKGKARGQWMDLTVGTFTTLQQQGSTTAEMKFYLLEYEGGYWKNGLVIKGVVIRPTNGILKNRPMD